MRQSLTGSYAAHWIFDNSMPISQSDAWVAIPELDTDFVFRRRPISIPGDLRPTWKIGLLVLVLRSNCRGGRATLARLHLICWALSRPDTQAALLGAISGQLDPRALIVRFDPFLERALQYAIGEKLITRWRGNAVELTQSGKIFGGELMVTDELFALEKKYLALIGKEISEKFVNRIFGQGAVDAI